MTQYRNPDTGRVVSRSPEAIARAQAVYDERRARSRVRLTPEDKALLDQLADEDDESSAGMVVKLIEEEMLRRGRRWADRLEKARERWARAKHRRIRQGVAKRLSD